MKKIFALCLFALTFSMAAVVLSHAQAKPACIKPQPPKPPTPPTPPPTPTPTPPSQSTSTNNNVNTNTNSATSAANSSSNAASSSTSSANSNQSQGQQQSQTATGGNATGGSASASNGGQSNSQTSVTNNDTPRQAPAASAPLVLPTANCLGGISGGASAPVGGLSFGSTKVDKECRMQALANEFIGMGNFEAAAKVLCSTKSAHEAHLTIDDCRLVVKPVPSQVVIAAPVQVPTVPQVTIYEELTVVATKEEAKAAQKSVSRKPAPTPKRTKCTKEVPCEYLEK